jgi:hypothetical protein
VFRRQELVGVLGLLVALLGLGTTLFAPLHLLPGQSESPWSRAYFAVLYVSILSLIGWGMWCYKQAGTLLLDLDREWDRLMYAGFLIVLTGMSVYEVVVPYQHLLLLSSLLGLSGMVLPTFGRVQVHTNGVTLFHQYGRLVPWARMTAYHIERDSTARATVHLSVRSRWARTRDITCRCSAEKVPLVEQVLSTHLADVCRDGRAIRSV